MPRRKELQGVATNLVSFLSSRNNDHLGYWTVGQLYLFAEEQGVTTVTFNLANNTVTPSTTKFEALFPTISNCINRYLTSRNIPNKWLANAVFSISFNQPYEAKYHYFGSALGKPYIIESSLTSDLGRTFKAKTGGNCRLHNPQKEQRRSGF